MTHRPRLFLLAVCTCFCWASPSAATVVDPPEDLGELAAAVDAVVVAEPVEQWVEPGPYWPVTVTRFRVTGQVAGDAVTDDLAVELPGGRWSGSLWKIAGVPRFQAPGPYLLFLDRVEAGRWTSPALAHGVFHKAERNGAWYWVPTPEIRDLTALPGTVWEPRTVFSAGPLEAHLKAVVDREESWAPRDVAAPPAAGRGLVRDAPGGCMYMGQSRRFVFDLGGEVTVRRGQVGHPDYADGGTAALQTGLAMWNEDPGSNIRFVYGGVGGEPDCGDPGDFFAAGVADTVIFEDPCGGIEEDWIRAMTGIILEGSGPFDGDLWDIVVGSIIVFNEGHDISEPLFESLMAHELGHVVAFAHHTGEPALMNDVNQDGAVLRGLDRVCAAHLYPHPASDVGLDFSWSPDAPRGGESVTFSATAPVDPDGWRWWFSDGSVFEGRQVVRRFANAGTVSVALTIEEGEAQAQRTHAVEVIEPSTGVVAAVANTPGVGDTDWHTDLVLVNRSDETAGGSFECRSRTGEICGSMDYEIPPGHLHVVDNVLASLGDEQNGSLLVLPATDAMSLSASRTYTASPTGSYGQAIPGMNAVGPGTFFIPSVRWNDAFRTNIGIASAADVPIRLHLELHVGPDESVTATRSVPPFAWRQWRLTDLFGGVDTQAATIEVEIDGPAVVYASVVDNVSGDPIFVEAAALSKHWQVPIVASAEGANDTSWDTGLFVFNGDEEAATVHLALNRDGEAVVAYLQVEPAQTIHVGSLLSSMWGVEQGAGAVDIVSAARLAVNARISTSTPAGGTAGQRIPALAMDDPDPAGRTLAWIREDALYRTNIGLSNLSGQRAEVELRLRAADGSVVGSITQSVGRRRVVQKSLVQLFGDGAVADLGGPGWIDAVDVVPVSPPVVLYSSVVDNQSGDPVLDLAR